MDKKQVEAMIYGYVNGDKAVEERSRNQILEVINNPEFLDIFIKCSSNRMFRIVCKDFNLPQSVVDKRERYEKEILNNYANKSVNTVKEAICDLLFHESAQNVKLTIEEMRERAKYDPEFNKIYQVYAPFYDKIYELLEMTDENYNEALVGYILKDLSLRNAQIKSSGQNIKDETELLHGLATRSFKKELAEDIKESGNKIFEGIEPELYYTADGKPVQMYKLQKQTPNQENYQILVRTNRKADYLYQEDARQKYMENAAKYDYLSYSVNSDSLNTGFASKKRVKFGYFDLGTGQIICCNTHDSGSNSFNVYKAKVYRQDMPSVPEFLRRTSSYNEVVLENPETVLPSVIISPTPVPDEDTIQIAAAMGIPIMYIDEKYYQQQPSYEWDALEDSQFYSHDAFLKEQLEPLNPKVAQNNYTV